MTYMYLLGIGIITYWLAQKGFRILNLFIPLWLIQLIFFCGLGIYVMAYHYYGNWSDVEVAFIIALVLANLLAMYPSIDYSSVDRTDEDSSSSKSSAGHRRHRNLLRETLNIMMAIAVIDALTGSHSDHSSDDSDYYDDDGDYYSDDF